MRHKTAEDVRLEHTKKMGQDLGTLYDKLWSEVAWLHSKWAEYVVLYGTKPSRIALLNRAAPRFFRIVEITLFEETLLHIARLTDAPEMAKKNNLSILRLPSLIHDAELAQQTDQLIKKALETSKFCRDWRNRRIAHNDLQLALDSGAAPLQPASRAQVKDCLRALAAVLNAVSGHYLNSESIFDRSLNTNGAVDLLYVLDDGLRHADERKARITSRTYTPEDIAARDL